MLPKKYFLCFVNALLLLLISGCAHYTSNAEFDKNGYRTRYYFGGLRVVENKNNDKSTVIERIQMLGLRIFNGFSIGYVDEKMIKVPLDCRVVLIVKNIEELNNSIAKYPQFLNKEQQLCAKILDF